MLLASHLVMLMMRIKLSEKDLGNFKESLSSLTIDQEVSVAGFGLVTPSMILDKNEKTIENKFPLDKTWTFIRNTYKVVGKIMPHQDRQGKSPPTFRVE